jgi:hypothetical protein
MLLDCVEVLRGKRKHKTYSEFLVLVLMLQVQEMYSYLAEWSGLSFYLHVMELQGQGFSAF